MAPQISILLIVMSCLIPLQKIVTQEAKNQSIPEDILQLSVQEAIRIAKFNAFELKQKSRSKSLEDRAANLRFWRSLFPKVDLSYSGSDSVTYNSDDSYSKNIGLSLSLPIYQGGKLQRQRQIYLSQSRTQKLELETEYKELEAQTWLAFYQTQLRQQAHQLSRESLNISSKDYKVSLKKHSIGGITTLELTNIEIELARMQIRTQEAKNQYIQAQEQLRDLLQIPEPIEFQLLGDSQAVETQLLLPEALEKLKNYLYSQLLQNNLTLKKLDSQIFQVTSQLKELKMRFIPHISLNSSISISGQDFPLRTLKYSFGLSLSLEGVGSPANLGATLGGNNQKNRTRSLNASVSPLQDLTVPITVGIQEIALETLYKKRKQLYDKFKNSIEQSITEYQLLYQQMELAGRIYDLNVKKEKISKQEYEKGLLEQVELFRAREETYKSLLSQNQYIIDTQKFIYNLSISMNQNIGEFIKNIRDFAELNSSYD